MFQSAPQIVTVVAALQSTAAHGLRQIADSGCPNTRSTKCSAETASTPLAVAFIAVAGVIGYQSGANGFHCPQPTKAEQKRRRVGVLRLTV